MGEKTIQVCVFVYLSLWKHPKQPCLLGPQSQIFWLSQ